MTIIIIIKIIIDDSFAGRKVLCMPIEGKSS